MEAYVSITRLSPKGDKQIHLEDLETHTEAYVTIGELARYWHVSRQQIYKQIEAGTLPAIRLGPRLLRVATAEALKFERHAHMRVPDTGHRALGASADKTAVAGRRTKLSIVCIIRISVRTSHLVCDFVDTHTRFVYHIVSPLMRIRDLATHPGRYLTVAELAEYWAVSRQQIYKRIESGALATIRFGVRCYRIPTGSALAFERRVQSQSKSTECAGAGHAIAEEDQLAARAASRRLVLTGFTAFSVPTVQDCSLVPLEFFCPSVHLRQLRHDVQLRRC